jgi:predicted dinucleotide-binding enzyme
VVVLAVPYAAAATIAGEVAGVAPDAIIVDATNPILADGSGLATAGGPSGAEHLAGVAGSARVVKAFNTLFASIQADPSSLEQRVDGLIAADDPIAKATVAELARSIGLRPVDAGPLAEAATLEAMAWLNISLQMRTGGDWRSTFVLAGAPQAAILGDAPEAALAS